jgi:hypothetical protein
VIRVDDIPLCVADQVAERYYPVDLAELLFLPQVGFPDPAGLLAPPSPPYRYEFAPGTLYWPTGASRFALGQYVATEDMVNAIRLAADGDALANPCTLTLAGQLKEDSAHVFQMHFLHALPLQFHYGAGDSVSPRPIDAGVYLLLLVDRRYFFQTHRATWTVDDTTTWADLDTDLETYLGVGTTVDNDSRVLIANVFGPGLALQEPGLPGAASIPTVGALLDAYCHASGRRFVSRRDGTCWLQSGLSARAHATAQSAALRSIRYGGDLAFPADATELPLPLPAWTSRHGFVVPETVTVVFPGTDGTDQVTPFEVSATVGGGAPWPPTWGLWPTNAVPFLEGELVVNTAGWNDGTNDSDCTDYALAWIGDWWNWLAQPEVAVYSGIVPFEPTGAVESFRWVTRQADVRTEVSRGVLNPRPPLVHVYSGVDPPPAGGGPAGSTITVTGGVGTDTFSSIGTVNYDTVYTSLSESPAGTANVDLVEASGSSGGVLTDAAQEIVGEKTFIDFIEGFGAGIALYDDVFPGSADTGWGISLSGGAVSMQAIDYAGPYTWAVVFGSGGPGSSMGISTPGGELILINDAGIELDTGQVFAIGGSTGATGTDPTSGLIFVGGICVGGI